MKRLLVYIAALSSLLPLVSKAGTASVFVRAFHHDNRVEFVQVTYSPVDGEVQVYEDRLNSIPKSVHQRIYNEGDGVEYRGHNKQCLDGREDTLLDLYVDGQFVRTTDYLVPCLALRDVYDADDLVGY